MATDDEFRAFVAASYPALIRTARLLADGLTQAEDLTQSALERTYVHWRSLRNVESAEAYSRTVLVRLAMRGARRRWRGELPTESVPERTTADAFAEVDAADAVRRALAALPVEQRAVLVLRYYAQLSEAEIAEMLRCSPGTVKSRASRALAALRHSGLLDDVEATDG